MGAVEEAAPAGRVVIPVMPSTRTATASGTTRAGRQKRPSEALGPAPPDPRMASTSPHVPRAPRRGEAGPPSQGRITWAPYNWLLCKRSRPRRHLSLFLLSCDISGGITSGLEPCHPEGHENPEGR